MSAGWARPRSVNAVGRKFVERTTAGFLEPRLQGDEAGPFLLENTLMHKSFNPSRVRIALLVVLLTFSFGAQASFLPPELEDKAAFGLAWFVLIVMPPLAIGLFWFVHILPEKIAHKKHHPQTEAITTLCLLSLFFGGLLWPIAWLWAYTKPVGYKMAYGTDKHDDYFIKQGEKVLADMATDTLTDSPTDDSIKAEVLHLKAELEQMAKANKLSPELEAVRQQLAAKTAAQTEQGEA